MAWVRIVCYTAVLRVVTQRSGALRDETKNGCVADYWHVEFQISKFQAAIFVEWKAPEVPLRQYGCF